jgi:Protoglobin
MREINEAQLEANLGYRFRFVTEFIGFSSDDAAAIQEAAPYLGPLIPQIVERTYNKLLEYTATARHFVPQQSGLSETTPQGLAGVNASHPHVQFRKEHLSRYFMQILGRSCNEQFVSYLDMVGKIHTTHAGNPEIQVPLVQMNALMGFLADLLVEIIASLSLDNATTIRFLRAYNKLLWIQNDFITRHYVQTKPGTS